MFPQFVCANDLEPSLRLRLDTVFVARNVGSETNWVQFDPAGSIRIHEHREVGAGSMAPKLLQCNWLG
eukprot:scaffold228935_cov38-Prasinocladus_malaysianus.AAC.1